MSLVRPYNRPVAEKVITDNRRARHEYHLLERHEAGMVLTGTEVKSLRQGRITLGSAYAEPRGGHFAPVEASELVAADIAAFFQDLSNDQ